MNKNKSDISLFKAFKLYTGRNFFRNILEATALCTVMYIIYRWMFSKDGDLDLFPKGDLTMLIPAGLICLIMTMAEYDKKMPGGKFFRTVKGGFDTFVKCRITWVLLLIATVILYSSIAALLHVTGIFPLKYGVSTCISAVIFLILANGITSFSFIIKNESARAVISTISFLMTEIVGVTALLAGTDGQLGMIHVITLIAAVILLIVSTKAMLRSYKKNRWNC